MMVTERNLNGKIVKRQYDLNKSYKDLQEEIWKLQTRISELELTLSLVSAKAMSTIPTQELITELTIRMHDNVKKAEKYDKLVVKHKKASNLIAELKKGDKR